MCERKKKRRCQGTEGVYIKEGRYDERQNIATKKNGRGKLKKKWRTTFTDEQRKGAADRRKGTLY
jgi:hypothetical protein